MSRILKALAFVLMALPSAAWAWVGQGPGQSPCGLGAWFSDPLKVGKPVRVWFSMDGRYNGGALGTARIRLPSGLRLLTGDTLFVGRPGSEWVLKAVPEGEGDYVITGSLTFTRSDGIVDESDMRLAFSLRGEKASIEGSEPTRFETLRNGQRYRYGGRFLVPIDGAEAITQADIERSGRRASGPRVLETSCASCKGDQVLPMVAFIGADGRVVGGQLRNSLRRFREDLVAAAMEAMGTAQYRPAQAKGKAVADWLLVDVRVRSRQ